MNINSNPPFKLNSPLFKGEPKDISFYEISVRKYPISDLSRDEFVRTAEESLEAKGSTLAEEERAEEIFLGNKPEITEKDFLDNENSSTLSKEEKNYPNQGKMLEETFKKPELTILSKAEQEKAFLKHQYERLKNFSQPEDYFEPKITSRPKNLSLEEAYHLVGGDEIEDETNYYTPQDRYDRTNNSYNAKRINPNSKIDILA